jgi:hypothetical protein
MESFILNNLRTLNSSVTEMTFCNDFQCHLTSLTQKSEHVYKFRRQVLGGDRTHCYLVTIFFPPDQFPCLIVSERERERKLTVVSEVRWGWSICAHHCSEKHQGSPLPSCLFWKLLKPQVGWESTRSFQNDFACTKILWSSRDSPSEATKPTGPVQLMSLWTRTDYATSVKDRVYYETSYFSASNTKCSLSARRQCSSIKWNSGGQDKSVSES